MLRCQTIHDDEMPHLRWIKVNNPLLYEQILKADTSKHFYVTNLPNCNICHKEGNQTRNDDNLNQTFLTMCSHPGCRIGYCADCIDNISRVEELCFMWCELCDSGLRGHCHLHGGNIPHPHN